LLKKHKIQKKKAVVDRSAYLQQPFYELSCNGNFDCVQKYCSNSFSLLAQREGKTYNDKREQESKNSHTDLDFVLYCTIKRYCEADAPQEGSICICCQAGTASHSSDWRGVSMVMD
jgi:hypothetical protein